MNPLCVKQSHGQCQVPCYHFTIWKKKAHLWLLNSHHQVHSHPLIQKYDAFPLNDLRASDPRPWFYNLIALQCCFNELNLDVETTVSLVMLFTEHSPPHFYFAFLHFEFKACCQHGKYQSSDMAASGYVPWRDLSSTTYSNPSPNSYQKFPW